MGPYKEVWPASQAEMCPFQIPQLEPVFMSQASACQAWAFCLAVAPRLGQKMCSYMPTMFHMGAFYCHKVGITELGFGWNSSVVLNWFFVSQAARKFWILQVRKYELSVAPIDQTDNRQNTCLLLWDSGSPLLNGRICSL